MSGNQSEIPFVNDNGITSISHADNIIEKFNILKDSLNEKITNINSLITNIPSVENNFVSENTDETKTKITEYFTKLLEEKEKIDVALRDLESQEEIINDFEEKKRIVIEELKASARVITKKRDAFNASTDNNNEQNNALSGKMDNIQTKKSRVIDLSRGTKKLRLMVDSNAINKIKTVLNTKFFKLRFDLRQIIVTFYETLSGTNSGLLNAKVLQYTNNLSNTNKISILEEIKATINKMLKYVTFCETQISENKLGNITIYPLNNQSPNKNYNTTVNLLSKIGVLKQNLTKYKTELSNLRQRLTDNFEKELKELTKKIIDATDELKKCIDAYITSLNFSSPNNQKKISKHSLEDIETNAQSMKLQMNEIKTKLNTIVTNQTTKSNAKLVDIFAKLDSVLGPKESNTSSPNSGTA